MRPRLHVWGILVHGWGVYVAVSDADTSKGGSTLVDLLVFVLSKLRSKGVPLDKFDFCAQLDNTSSCNKNNVALAFAACCAHFKLLSSVRLCFLRAGHTHEDFGGWMRGWLLQTTMKLEALMINAQAPCEDIDQWLGELAGCLSLSDCSLIPSTFP